MKKLLLVLGASAMLAAPAIAGINPAAPGLPTASTTVAGWAYTGISTANNQSSSMCVDCHTVQPKAGGSHFVNASSVVSQTNSGGSGNLGAAGAISTRDNGAYFKVTLWSVNTTGAATYSKYRNGTNLSVAPALVNGVQSATLDATVANYDSYDIICESCHNIVVNDIGGNNLLAAQPSNDWEDAATADLCVGCHGFMYTTDAVGNAGNVNYASALNDNEVNTGTLKDNNEQHWIKGVAYRQNHHVMTNDEITSVTAGAGRLWTDNLVVSYTDNPISNASTLGTYPQKATWTITGAANVKPAGGGLNCTNCHTPAHGMSGSAGASILRGATYTAARANALSRISDASAWKKINDRVFCNQCHN